MEIDRDAEGVLGMKTILAVLAFLVPLTAQSPSLKDQINLISKNWFETGLLCGKAFALAELDGAASRPVSAPVSDFLKTCERYQKDFGIEP